MDKLLSESNERLQSYLKERMTAHEEKNALKVEIGQLKEQLEDVQHDKSRVQGQYEGAKQELDSLRETINKIR